MFFKSIKRGIRPLHAPLVTTAQIRDLNLYRLQALIRAMASPVYLGRNLCLCRVLGRYRLYVTADDVGFGAHVLLDGAWELWITQYIAGLIKPGHVAVDVGANHGYFTLFMADLVGERGQVVAIEPNPDLFGLLSQSVAVNGFASRTRLHHLAATDTDEVSLQLVIPNNEPKNGHLSPFPNDPRAIPIKGMSLNSLLADLPRLDFLKIDVEGAEEAVLDGGWALIEQYRPDIILEFNHHRCRDPKGLLARIRALYGPLYHLNQSTQRVEIDDEALLDPNRIDDWMLHLSRQPLPSK